ncbi:MAG: T9SS type A sorting domain-containing protein, partial [Bacteroidota bacterium]
MKNYFLIFFFLLIGWSSLFAQLQPPTSTNCGISFNYDNAGNRIKRYLCLNNLPLQFSTETTEDQLTNVVDLEESLEGYSDVLESEIEKLEALLSQPSKLDLKSVDNQKFTLDDQDFSDLSSMVVFPNPTITNFSIQGEGLSPESTLSIISMDGQILSQRVLGDGRDIDVSSLPVGAYVLTLVDGDERRVSM